MSNFGLSINLLLIYRIYPSEYVFGLHSFLTCTFLDLPEIDLGTDIATPTALPDPLPIPEQEQRLHLKKRRNKL